MINLATALTPVKNEFQAFLSTIMDHVPLESQAQIQTAAQNVHTAISSVESTALDVAEAEAPTLAAIVAKAVPSEFSPLVSLVVKLGVEELQSRGATTPAS